MLLHENIRHTISIQIQKGSGVWCRHEVIWVWVNTTVIVLRFDQELGKISLLEFLRYIVFRDEHCDVVLNRVENNISPKEELASLKNHLPHVSVYIEESRLTVVGNLEFSFLRETVSIEFKLTLLRLFKNLNKSGTLALFGSIYDIQTLKLLHIFRSNDIGNDRTIRVGFDLNRPCNKFIGFVLGVVEVDGEGILVVV